MRRSSFVSACVSVVLAFGCGEGDDEAPVQVYVDEGRGGGGTSRGGAAGGLEEGELGGAGAGGAGGDPSQQEGGASGTAGGGGTAATGGAGGYGGDAAMGGTGGSAGKGGTSGSAGKGGTSGSAGKAGTAGKGGSAGKGGTSGSAGKAGTGGSGGQGGKGGGSGGGGLSGNGGTAGASGGSGSGLCPEGMAFVDAGAFCVDRWEAQVDVVGADGTLTLHSPYETLDALDPDDLRAATREGVAPQGYISGAQAKAACAGAGKRLCTYDEHLTACSGPDDLTWPYGDTRQVGACNEGRAKHPVIELFGPNATFDNAELNDPALNQLPDSLGDTGSYPACVSAYGAYDLAGNLHEWVEDPAGTFVGGFYVDAVKNFPGCLYKTTAHAFTYHDYSTGFRCCAEPS